MCRTGGAFFRLPGVHAVLTGEDLRPAEEQGLLRVAGDGIEFGHPLIRAAAYESAPLSSRIAAHQSLARALGDEEQDRRAWHLAAAATGPDEEVALLLEDTAEHARSRGGLPSEAPANARPPRPGTPRPPPRPRRPPAAGPAGRRRGSGSRSARLRVRARAFGSAVVGSLVPMPRSTPIGAYSSE
jgi:hypothetical protein